MASRVFASHFPGPSRLGNMAPSTKTPLGVWFSCRGVAFLSMAHCTLSSKCWSIRGLRKRSKVDNDSENYMEEDDNKTTSFMTSKSSKGTSSLNSEAVDNDKARSMASEKVGFDTNSLLEQWRDTYENGDYDYDPYDDDMYEGQEIDDKIQAICDNLDIKV
ncbi:hypothetical protein Tco_0798333 [Tanacetum coccineum]